MAKEVNNILVSVCVITYNSSKTVLETLESIKAQTYPRIELIISDDCSKDDTVSLCSGWLAKNGARFDRTKLIEAKNNTGVSGNLNRGEDACRGEWVKSVAGDDLLFPTSIQDYMDYVLSHPDTIYLFGKQVAFGANAEICEEVNKKFDYSFFLLRKEEQLERLIFEGNCVPATTVFYNREKAKQIGVVCDERIPLIEDWPKWINLIRAGVKLHFIDKELVKYRVGGISTDRKWQSVGSFESGRKFCLLYQYPEWVKEDPEKAVERVVADEVQYYQYLLDLDRQLELIRDSKAYRLGKMMLNPFRWFKK